jgi:DNA-binding MarR family transcriptional regulator
MWIGRRSKLSRDYVISPGPEFWNDPSVSKQFAVPSSYPRRVSPNKHPPMKLIPSGTTSASVKADAGRLADFVLFTQRGCILNLSKELNRGNLSYPQFFLLTYLCNEEYLTMTDIAAKMGHSTAAATGLVDRIEKLGYVERVHASEDRRKIMVRITSKGVEFVSHMRKEIATDLAGILSSMDEEAAETVEHTKRAISSRQIA